MFLLILKMKRIRFGTTSISKDKECAGLEFRLEDVCVFVSPWVHGYELVAECCKGECGFVLQWRSGQCTTLCVFAMIECTPRKCIYDLLSPSVCVFSAARVSVCVKDVCVSVGARVSERGWKSYDMWQLVGWCQWGRMEQRRKRLLPRQRRAGVADGRVAWSSCQLRQWELRRNNANDSLLLLWLWATGLRNILYTRETHVLSEMATPHYNALTLINPRHSTCLQNYCFFARCHPPAGQL